MQFGCAAIKKKRGSIEIIANKRIASFIFIITFLNLYFLTFTYVYQLNPYFYSYDDLFTQVFAILLK